MNKVCYKLKSQKGESIAEVLIAAVIAALGVVLFVTMLNSAFRMLSKEDTKYSEFIEKKNDFESLPETIDIHNGTVTITDSLDNPTFRASAVVKIYSKEYEDYDFKRYEVLSWED